MASDLLGTVRLGFGVHPLTTVGFEEVDGQILQRFGIRLLHPPGVLAFDLVRRGRVAVTECVEFPFGHVNRLCEFLVGIEQFGVGPAELVFGVGGGFDPSRLFQGSGELRAGRRTRKFF